MTRPPLFPLPVGGLPSRTARKVMLSVIGVGLAIAAANYTWRENKLQQRAINAEDDRTTTALYYFVSHEIGQQVDDILQGYGLCENINRCTLRIDYGEFQKGLTQNQYHRQIELGSALVFISLSARAKYAELKSDYFSLEIKQYAPFENGDLRSISPALNNAINAIIQKFGFDWTTIQQCLPSTRKGFTETSCRYQDNELAGQRLKNGHIGRSSRTIRIYRQLQSREPGAWLKA